MTAIASNSAAFLSQTVDSANVPKATLSDRFILTQVQPYTLLVPAIWVAEIFRVERSQILPLPFYDPLLIGITHQSGRVLPLLSAHTLLKAEPISLRETIIVVKLGDMAGALAQVGLVIDRSLGSKARADLPSAVFLESSRPSSSSSMVLLRPEQIDSNLWQPLFWTPTSSL